MTALIVADQDDAASSVNLALRLRWPDMKFGVVATAREARRRLVNDPPDMIFLSAMLLGDNLHDLIQEIRKAWGILIIVVGSDEKESDVIDALESGADDYISIPIRESLLVARVSAVLRRVRRVSTEKAPKLTCGDLLIDPEGHEAQLNGEPLYLTPTEFTLLVHLTQNQERVVTLEGLETIIWGTSDKLYVEVLRQHVQRLRRKLQPSGDVSATIRTVPRVGYILAATNGARARR